MTHHCPNCQSDQLVIDDLPPWNAPASHKKTITISAKCLNCGKRLQYTNTFNKIEEYIEATKGLKKAL